MVKFLAALLLPACVAQQGGTNQTAQGAATDEAAPEASFPGEPGRSDPMVSGEDGEPWCQPLTQGFWKRQCKGDHPSGEIDRLPGYVDCVNDAETFAALSSVAELCERLHPEPPNEKCEQAEAQLMALRLNVCSGRLDPSCCTSSSGGDAPVVVALAQADSLLAAAARTFDDCVLAQAIADGINRGATLAECPDKCTVVHGDIGGSCGDNPCPDGTVCVEDSCGEKLPGYSCLECPDGCTSCECVAPCSMSFCPCSETAYGLRCDG